MFTETRKVSCVMVVQVLIETGIDNCILVITLSFNFHDNLFSSSQVSSCMQMELY
jgi:hypothetical protein